MSVPETSPDRARLLLDTHVFLWWADGAIRRLRPAAREAIAGATSVHVSLASAWELAVKRALKKMHLGVTFARALEINSFSALPVALEHVEQIAALPPYHGDPFDRMLVAQAQHEGLTLVTHDDAIGRYDVPVLWA